MVEMKFESSNIMKTTMLSNQEKKDLFKFIRLFSLKASQVIVQSRLGQRDSTTCKQHSSGTDWFNLNIYDIPEVLVEARKVINNNESTEYPTCIEISLKTSEGDHMVLETWCISLLPDECNPSPRIIPTVYNHMGLLLKSLISVTRVTPSYKLSRRQGPDSYIMCYRVYIDKPQLHTLGDGYKQVRIGQVCTPIGTLQLGVAYRIKMTISPTHSSSNNSIMLKSDHFNTNLSPKNLRTKQSEEKARSRKLQPAKAAFADPRPPRSKEPVAAFKPGGVLWNPKLYYAIVEGKEFVEENKEVEDPFTYANITKRWQEINKENLTRENENKSKATSPTSSTKTLDNEEVGTNSSSGSTDQAAGRLELGTTELVSSNASLNKMEESTISTTSSLSLKVKFKQPQRRVGKPVHYPFATPTPRSELMNFYRECAHAPPLESLKTSLASITDITEQLESFEMKVQEYDDMVKELCQSPESED